MDYKIIADSSADVADDMRTVLNTVLIPFSMDLEGHGYRDDDQLDLDKYMNVMTSSDKIPKTACPSPADYLAEMRASEGNLYLVTISSSLSGSYNAAMLAKSIFLEENPDRNVHVFDSKSASAGEHAIVLKVHELVSAGLSFMDVVATTEMYIKGLQTLFVLESIENLYKTGRMSHVKKLVADVLNIKLILAADRDGEIQLRHSGRGMKQSLKKLVSSIEYCTESCQNQRLIISHCRAESRAMELKRIIGERYDFGEIIIIPTMGLSSNYANIGGVIVAF